MCVSADGKELPEGELPPQQNGEEEEEEEGSGSSGEEEEEEEEGDTEGSNQHSNDDAKATTPTSPADDTDKPLSPPPAASTPTPPVAPPASQRSSPPLIPPPPPPPPSTTEASILDKLASFTNGKSGKPPTYGTRGNVLAAAAAGGGGVNEESAISKLSNFVKDPGKLLSKPTSVVDVAAAVTASVPPHSSSSSSSSSHHASVRVPPPSQSQRHNVSKVPTPPSLPAAYQQYIAAAAAAAAVSSSFMLSTAPPPVSSPTLSDPDLPLDLSVKAKGLDLSTKTPKTPLSSSSSSSSSSQSSNKYISPPPPSKSRSTKESGGSSLKSLEQKFGSNAFPFDSMRGGSSSYKSHLYRHPMMPAFGGNLYTSALFNTQSLPTTDLIYRPESTPTKNQTSSSSSSLHSHSQAATRHSPRREHKHEKPKHPQSSTSSSSSAPSAPPKSSTPSSSSSTAPPAVSSASSSTTSSNDTTVTSAVTTGSSSTAANATNAAASVAAADNMAAAILNSAAAAAGSGGASSPSKDKRHTTLLCKCGKDYVNLYDLTLHLRETGHSPNDKGGVQPEYPKLVRGQDMWLNQGSEQTRQILRCMQCGESFKSLPELTVHMIDTKHYTNIVGTDTSSLSRKVLKLGSSDSGSDSEVFKCQVCDMTYENMEGLTTHMMSSGHHKRPVIIQPESPKSPPTTMPPTPLLPPVASSPKTPRSASPMSLSLMEYKYKLAKLAAEHHHHQQQQQQQDGSGGVGRDSNSPGSDFLAEISKITCETCGDRIEMGKFVEHVRVCIGKRSHLKHKPNGMDTSSPLLPHGSLPSPSIKKRKLEDDGDVEDDAARQPAEKSATVADDDDDDDIQTTAAYIKKERHSTSSDSPRPKSEPSDHHPTHLSNASMRSSLHSNHTLPNTSMPKDSGGGGSGGSSSDSALKAMESFIERSFTSVTSHLRSRYFPFKGPVRNTFMTSPSSSSASDLSNNAAGETRDSRGGGSVNTADTNSHSSSNKYHSKYLPPLYVNPDAKPIMSPIAATAAAATTSLNPNTEKSLEQDSKVASSLKRKNSVGGGSRSPTPPVKIKKEKEDHDVKSPLSSSQQLHPQSKTPSPPVSVSSSTLTAPSSASKYIQEEAEGNKSSIASKGGSVSALESLQGLVYGKNFNTEHPLDSLQKLLHTPHIPANNGGAGGQRSITPGGGVRSITPQRSATPGGGRSSTPNGPSSANSPLDFHHHHQHHPHHQHLKQNGQLVRDSNTPRKNTQSPIVATANVTLLPSAMSPLQQQHQRRGGSTPRSGGSPSPRPSPRASPRHILPRPSTPTSGLITNNNNNSGTSNSNDSMVNSPGSGGVVSPHTPHHRAPSSHSHNSEHNSVTSPPGTPLRSDGEDDGDAMAQGEYECNCCKRLFVSRGSYRYHIGRCRVALPPPSTHTALKQEPPNSTTSPNSPPETRSPKQPYVYLPLDHTAKFNKYYEMANELANKTK